MNTNTELPYLDSAYQPAGVVRRIGAMIYDAMLTMAVLAVAVIPFLVFVQKKVLIPREVGWLVYSSYLAWQILIIMLFFGVFWTRRGQTLGMQVWRLRVEDEHGKLLSWSLAIRRVIFAALPWLPGFLCLVVSEQLQSPVLKWLGEGLLLLGLANLLMAHFTIGHRTWHDRMAGSRVVISK